MRIAVFSDIHGNFEALNTVMDLNGIINIPDRGLDFVSGVVLGTALVIIGLVWFQYRISHKRHQE